MHVGYHYAIGEVPNLEVVHVAGPSARAKKVRRASTVLATGLTLAAGGLVTGGLLERAAAQNASDPEELLKHSRRSNGLIAGGASALGAATLTLGVAFGGKW